jgi:hypothetical protein
MTYKINGVELSTQPTSGNWLPRNVVGTDGNGHNVYPPNYQFEITWNLTYPSDFYQVLQMFDNLAITGSCVVDLPKYRSATYAFYSYTGCVVQEPEISPYFAENITDVKLLITNIRA